ncbi:terpene cyclase [Penicillium herquei]|nr:terpene cyclase [Penicillium herquei]
MSVHDLVFEQHDSLCSQLPAQTEIQYPVWEVFFKALPGLLAFYGPCCQKSLFRRAFKFIQATAVERTFFCGYAGSKFSDFVRRRSAQGPVLGVVCSPEQEFPQEEYLPIIASVIIASAEVELEDWVGTVNDIFSFYKEVDRINYLLNVSACAERTTSEVLWEISDTALACKGRLEAILKSAGKENVQCLVQEFLTGYVRYHLACDKYRISELCEKFGEMDLIAYYRMSLRAVGAFQGSFVSVHPQATRSSTHKGTLIRSHRTWSFGS